MPTPWYGSIYGTSVSAVGHWQAFALPVRPSATESHVPYERSLRSRENAEVTFRCPSILTMIVGGAGPSSGGAGVGEERVACCEANSHCTLIN